MTGTNNPIELKVGIVADTVGSKAGIQAKLDLLSADLKGLNVGLNTGESTKGLEDMRKTIAKLTTDIENLKKSSGGGKPLLPDPAPEAEKIITTLEKVGKKTDVVFAHMGSGFKKAMREGITSQKQLLDAFEGMSPKLKMDVLNVEDDGKIKKIIQGATVEYRNLQGEIERATFSAKEFISVGKGATLQPIFQPNDMVQVINDIPRVMSTAVKKSTEELRRLKAEGKITSTQFDELAQSVGKFSKTGDIEEYSRRLYDAKLKTSQLSDAKRESVKIENQLNIAQQKTIQQLERMAAAGKLSQPKAQELISSVGTQKSMADMDKLRQSIALTAVEYRNMGQASVAMESLSQRIKLLTISTQLSSAEATKWLGKYNSASSAGAIKQINTDLTTHLATQKQVNAEKAKEAAITEQIRKLTNSITAQQGRNPQAFGNNPEVAGMLNTLRQINPASQGAAASVRTVSHGFDTMRASATSAGRESMGVMDSFKVAMEKFPIWMAASTAFYGTVRSIRSAITSIISLDSQATVLRRVAGDGIDANKVLEESVRLAGELGNLIGDVNEGFIAFARQGFRGGDLSMMTEYATLLGNISDMSVDESASVLTAGIKGFNIEAENGIHIVNALNEVDNNFAI